MASNFYHMTTPRPSLGHSQGGESYDLGKEEFAITTATVESQDNEDQRNQSQHEKHSATVTFFEKWWIWEFVAWTISVLSFVSIAVVLSQFDQHSTPNWVLRSDRFHKHVELNVTLNSVISVFATIFKSTLLIPVAAALAQLKWIWFQDGHKLSDFQHFDNANQGPLGSITLIWAMRGRRLACLGALIIISTLALDFSFQQLVTYPIRRLPVATAFIPRANAYNSSTQVLSQFAGGFGNSGTYSNLDSSMIAAIYGGIFNTDSKSGFDPTPTCPSGNCTWDSSYTSLGFCSQCYNVTDDLHVNCGAYELQYNVYDNNKYPTTPPTTQIRYCNYTLPNSLSMYGYLESFASGETYTNITGDTTNSINFRKTADLISVLSVVRGQWPFITSKNDSIGIYYYNRLEDVSATECALYYCVKNYNATVVNGVLNETLVGTWSNQSAADNNLGLPSTDLILNPQSSFFKFTSANASHQFFVSQSSAEQLAPQFYQPGGNTAGFFSNPFLWTGTVNASQPDQSIGTSDVARHLYKLNFTGMSDMMSDLADSMTVNIRSNGPQSTRQPAQGVSTKDSVYVKVRWGWLALPATLLGLTLVFLFLTMFTSRRSGAVLWKASTLAAFYHPLSHDGRAKIRHAMSPKEMQKIAKEMHVRYEKTDRGYRLTPR